MAEPSISGRGEGGGPAAASSPAGVVDARDCEQRLSTLLENLPGMAYRCATDENWTMEFLSRGCEELTGYAPAELIGNRDLSYNGLIHPEYRETLRAHVLESLNAGERFECEYPIRTKSGGEKWVWERGVGVGTSREGVPALEGIVTDITERHRDRLKLKRSEERLRLLVEHLPTGAVFREENTLHLNQAAEEITGYSRSELHSVDLWFQKLYGLRHTGQRKKYEESRMSGFPVRRMLTITRKDGQRRWVEFAAYAYENGEVWLLHDNTELKTTEEDLREYQQQLRSLTSELSLAEDRERRRIATDLHDGLGQALSMAHVKLNLLRDLQTSTEAEDILDEARRLIDQTIAETRALTFALSSPVLHQLGLVPALGQLCEDMASQYGVKFSVQEDRWPKPLSSELRMVLFRCVRELLINVAKHAEAGEARVTLSGDEGLLRITVEDDGDGFDTSQIGRRFSPSGGFGLFNMHEYLIHMGGSMRIQSTPGRGTRVVVEAPPHASMDRNARDEEREEDD